MHCNFEKRKEPPCEHLFIFQGIKNYGSLSYVFINIAFLYYFNWDLFFQNCPVSTSEYACTWNSDF